MVLRRLPLALVVLPLLSAIVGCGAAPAARAVPIYTPAGPVVEPTWTPEELAKPVAVRRLHGDDHATTFLIHLGTAEKPHTHDQHDLAVVLVRGAARIHIGDRVEAMAPGDVVEIPRGTVHWAESTVPGGSVAYAIFTPGYDGTDTHPVAQP